MLALDCCIGDEVWPHICVEDCYGFVCVSNLCPVQFHLDVRFVHAEVSILVYVKVRVQALNFVHVTITLCLVLYSSRIRAKLRIRGLMFALHLCLKGDLRSCRIRARVRFDLKIVSCFIHIRVHFLLKILVLTQVGIHVRFAFFSFFL